MAGWTAIDGGWCVLSTGLGRKVFCCFFFLNHLLPTKIGIMMVDAVDAASTTPKLGERPVRWFPWLLADDHCRARKVTRKVCFGDIDFLKGSFFFFCFRKFRSKCTFPSVGSRDPALLPLVSWCTFNLRESLGSQYWWNEAPGFPRF